MIYVPGFVEFSLRVTDGKQRRTTIQVSKITDFFENNEGFTMVCMGETNTLIVNEPYDEVKRRVHYALIQSLTPQPNHPHHPGD